MKQQPEVVQLPQTDWQKMSREERMSFLVPLIGKRVRFVEERNYRKGVIIFGSQFPLPWVETRLHGLMPSMNGKPGVQLGYNQLEWDAIYTIEALQEAVMEEEVAEPKPDVMQALVCPHCGERLQLDCRLVPVIAIASTPVE